MHFAIELPEDESSRDHVWIRACARKLVALDAMLDPDDAQAIAVDMAQHRRWRLAPPDAAAVSLILDAAPAT